MIVAIAPAQFAREEVIATIHNVVAIGRKGSLPNWMVHIMLLLPPRRRVRGRGTGMTGAEVSVGVETNRKMAIFFSRARLSYFAWLKST